MKNLFTAILLAMSIAGLSQSLTITSPSGLSEPYEVASGTIVTVEWDYFEEDASGMYTYDQSPGSDLNTTYQFNTNPAWTTLSSGTDNGDGTFSYSITVTEDTWIFGMFSVFFGNSFSNVINISVASEVVLEDEDGLICSVGGTELLSLQGSFSNIAWYKDSVLIVGESGSTYNATEMGAYYAMADGIQSNIVEIEEWSIDFTGELSLDATEITLTADAGMDSYQWYSGPDTGNMTAISGANNATYTAAITSAIVYYHVEANIDLCDISSINRPVSEAIFTPFVLSVSADTNGFDNVCTGTTITLSIEEDAENYTWFKNGNSIYNNQTYYNITGVWGAGVFYVESNPTEWPEISVQSNSVDANYFELISPLIIGETNNSLHCEGDEIALAIADEGYDYTWYAHEEYIYNDTDIVETINNTLSFTFENAIRITVVASYQGCEESTTLSLNDYADQSLYISVTNWDQQYLCTDSIANIALPSYTADNYTNFQWHQKVGDDWVEIDGETEIEYGASEPGLYKMTATSINCATAQVGSNEYLVKDYTERPLNLYSDKTEMCLGDTATLNMYSNAWTNIQWLEGFIQIGSTSGYDFLYAPIIGAGTDNIQEVYEYNHYIVKAKHNSCPNGLKITSNPIIVKPSLNPNVIIDADIESYRLALWDSAITYLDCIGNEFTLSIDEEYDSYQWHSALYTGLGDYEIGDPIDGATGDSLVVEVDGQWVTAEVSLDGCIGYTDPILLNGWVFLSPAVASYSNDMICEGDSALLNLAFPGTWIEYYWLHDGDTVPNSNNDSIWVTEPGQYIIFAYPEECPTALYSSGLGPTLYDFEALILEDVDEFGNPFFYAWPWQGDYTYQWFIDGEPYDNPSDIPPVLWQVDLPAGEITVEIINNGDLCTDLSAPVNWDGNITGINEVEGFEFSVYPNPTSGEFTIKGLNANSIESVILYSTQGRAVRTVEINSDLQLINISDLPNGMYLLHITDTDGNVEAKTINKL